MPVKVFKHLIKYCFPCVNSPPLPPPQLSCKLLRGMNYLLPFLCYSVALLILIENELKLFVQGSLCPMKRYFSTKPTKSQDSVIKKNNITSAQ